MSRASSGEADADRAGLELRSRLPPTAFGVRAGRQFVRAALTAWGFDAQAQNAELLAAELVSNVVHHVAEPMTVRVRREPGVVRVEVDDTSREPPVVRDPAATDRVGRGLLLVDRLATCWGANVYDDGKTVWFELDVGPDGGVVEE